MSFIVFIILLAILIFVHELGHFLVAKWAGIKVHEFALGFPPRLYSRKYGETEYSLNLIPFGGYVRIFGEDSEGLEALSPEEKKTHFSFQPKWIQVAVLSAGVFFNILFAWIVLSVGFMFGFPTSVGETAFPVSNAQLIVTHIAKDSPAEGAHIKAGDVILSLSRASATLEKDITPALVRGFIEADTVSEPVTFLVSREGKTETLVVTPVDGVVAGKKAIGIGMDMVGVVQLPVHIALVEGAKLTGSFIYRVAVGLFDLVKSAIVLKADLSQVSGPVGIATLAGDAFHLGFVYLLSFAAFISLNLAVLNLMPFPALDGGRILFVIIEAIKRSQIRPKITQTVNAVGFGILIVLMLAITIHDIIKLF